MRAWWAERRRRRLEHEKVRQALREEYEAKLDLGDPVAMSTSRDWADSAGVPWRVRAGLAAALLVLFVSVALLVAFFLLIKSLTS